MNGETRKKSIGICELYVKIMTDPKTYNFGDMFGGSQPKSMAKGLLRLH